MVMMYQLVVRPGRAKQVSTLVNSVCLYKCMRHLIMCRQDFCAGVVSRRAALV